MAVQKPQAALEQEALMLWQDRGSFTSQQCLWGHRGWEGDARECWPPRNSLQPVLRLLSLSRRRGPLDAPMLLPDSSSS